MVAPYVPNLVKAVDTKEDNIAINEPYVKKAILK
jgi:hypothetical protein